MGLITRRSYNQGSNKERFLQAWDLQPGVLQRGVLKTRSSYNQGLLQPGIIQIGVLATRGLTN